MWITAQRWVVRVGSLATVGILTRVLRPEDFGLVAAASAVLPVIYLLSDFGFSTFLVQSPRISRADIATTFWFSVASGSVLALGLVLAAPLLADLYNLPGLTSVVQALAVSVGLVALGSVPTSLLRRRMEFRRLAIQGGIAALVAQLVAIGTVLWGLGVWALVAQTLSSQLVVCVLAWRAAGWRPSLEFSRSTLAQMSRFGVQIVGVEIVAMGRAWAENAIIVWSLGAAGLGYYNIGLRLIQVVQDLSAGAITPVSITAFARLQDQPERLRKAYLRAMRTVYAAVTPLMVFVGFGATMIVPILFGDGWSQSLPVVRALAAAGILVLGASLDQGIFYGVGKPGRWLGYAFAVDAATVATTAVAVRHGLVGVAIAFIAVAFVATIFRLLMLRRLLTTTWWTVAEPLKELAIQVIASAAVAAVVLLATPALPSLLRLALLAVGIAGAQFATVRLVSPGVLADLRSQIPSSIASRLSRGRSATHPATGGR